MPQQWQAYCITRDEAAADYRQLRYDWSGAIESAGSE
jgi:hypothetical protein